MYYQELQRFVAQADLAVSQKTKDYIKDYMGLEVHVGFGFGNFAKVPWISFLAAGQTTSNGIYPVYLYYREKKILVLAYGVSETNPPIANWNLPASAITVSDYLTQNNLGAPYRYGDSFVYKAYDLNNETIDGNYDVDLSALLTEYIATVSRFQTSNSSSNNALASTAPSGNSPVFMYPKNMILYGPPGTGKTYNTIRYAVSIIDGIDVDDVADDNTYIDSSGSSVDVKKEFASYLAKNQIRFTTFHQSLSYEDFIEGIKPKYDASSKVMTYPVEDGIFKRICDDARKQAAAAKQAGYEPEKYVMIIDEINRGNVAQIFGELITLIEEDKREGEKNEIPVILPYSSAEQGTTVKFTVPSNLYILGTMNTADRSVEALDTALRRRFTFIEMRPDASKVPVSIPGATPGTSISLRKIFKNINSRIEVLKDSEHQIGHSYFMKVDSVEKLMDVFQHKIIPLLQEYFFGDAERIKMVIGEEFFTPKKDIKKTVFSGYKGDVDFPDEILQIWDDAKWKACLSDSTHTEFIAAIDPLTK